MALSSSMATLLKDKDAGSLSASSSTDTLVEEDTTANPPNTPLPLHSQSTALDPEPKSASTYPTWLHNLVSALYALGSSPHGIYTDTRFARARTVSTPDAPDAPPFHCDTASRQGDETKPEGTSQGPKSDTTSTRASRIVKGNSHEGSRAWGTNTNTLNTNTNTTTTTRPPTLSRSLAGAPAYGDGMPMVLQRERVLGLHHYSSPENVFKHSLGFTGFLT
ncbi:hypothetical protein BDN70DRAFT_442982 [Pholiota conissans]|uniref:Uncharacterized protein n=1 Tax=Pholiota conissans TaxID=109636 RepID=A0A9P5Z8S2_9AGAR|nr:hypothetical protein BDN70DRAFT_442982 [Pholiota conissans]